MNAVGTLVQVLFASYGTLKAGFDKWHELAVKMPPLARWRSLHIGVSCNETVMWAAAGPGKCTPQETEEPRQAS